MNIRENSGIYSRWLSKGGNRHNCKNRYLPSYYIRMKKRQADNELMNDQIKDIIKYCKTFEALIEDDYIHILNMIRKKHHLDERRKGIENIWFTIGNRDKFLSFLLIYSPPIVRKRT